MGEYVTTGDETSLLSLPGGGEQYINTDLPTIREEMESDDTPSGNMNFSSGASDLSFSVFAIDENTEAFVAGKSGLVWSDFKVGYDGYYYQDSSIIDAEKHFNTLKDDMMCWAATTANMLYYTNWGVRSASDEESIFSIFVDNFQFGDKHGGDAYYGLKWFFTGDYLPVGWNGWDYPFEETGGFYEKAFETAVFSDYVTYATADHSGFTLAEEKLKDGYAVGLSVSFYDANGNYENGHAVTLWGFTYDTTLSVTDPNYYTGIIITDSDDDKDNYTDQVFPDTLKVLSMTYDSAKGHYVLAPEYHVSGSTIVNDFTFLAPNPGFAEDAAVTSTGAVKIYSSGRLVSQTSPVVSMELSASNCSAMYISSGGAAYSTEVNSGAYIYISSGGTAAQTTINNGGEVYISSGGTANNTVVNSFGSMILRAGGSANSTYVGSGGHLWLISATSPGAIEVARGGTLLLAGSCVATGDITLKGYLDSTLLVQGTLDMAGYTLNLDITERNSNSAAIVQKFPLISNADIVVTVSASQSSGDYCLIGSAANSVSITIQCGSEMQELGVGESFKFGSTEYTLTHSDGDLFLSVTNPATVPPVAVDEYIPGTWSTDWQQASEYAAKTGKKIFAFYGDVFYCPYSYYMENYLLKAEDFLEFAKENLVLLYNTPVPGKSYSGSPAGYILSADGSSLADRSGFGIDYHDVWMDWLKLQTDNAAGIYEERRSSIDHIGSTFSGTVDAALYIANSGIANQAIINSGTSIEILSGGTANSTTVNSRGSMTVFSGGTANSTTVNSYGSLYVSSGGTANATTVNSRGYLVVSGGTANATTVNSSAHLHIYSGGMANSTMLNSGCRLIIFSGGMANATTMNGGYDSYGGAFSDLTVSSGGMANSTTVNYEGYVGINSGGTANVTTVNSGGHLAAYAGGTANVTTVNSGGRLNVYSGGTANSTTVNYGDFYVRSGGTANSTTVNSYGYLHVSSGGTANDTTVNSGGDLYVKSGGTANDTTVRGGRLYVSSGGTANSTTVNSWGYLYISSGGTANDTTVNYGDLYVSSGGTATQNIVNAGGSVYVWKGGRAVETKINAYGTMILSSGGAADGTVINANGGLHVYSGAAASNTTVKQGGYLGVGLGATTYDTTIDYAGALTVWGGGAAYDNTINEYGAIILSSGAVADTTVVNADGGLHVYAGAVASNTTVKQGGFLGVGLGATTYNTLIDYAGELTVWSGGVVHVNEIDQWGAIILLDGAVANSTTINPGGGLHIYNGATAFTTEITSGANLGVGYGGCVYGTELDNTGTMTFYEGAIMTGWNNFEGTVITSGGVNGLGAYVNFELDDRTADQGAILDDIGNFYSVTRYSMEVGLDQALGTYDLAGDASDFGERVTLYIGEGNDCGSLAVGEYLDYNDKRYTLENNNGTLALKVS